MERSCQAQLMAEAAGTPVLIDDDDGQTHQKPGRQPLRRLVQLPAAVRQDHQGAARPLRLSAAADGKRTASHCSNFRHSLRSLGDDEGAGDDGGRARHGRTPGRLPIHRRRQPPGQRAETRPNRASPRHSRRGPPRPRRPRHHRPPPPPRPTPRRCPRRTATSSSRRSQARPAARSAQPRSAARPRSPTPRRSTASPANGVRVTAGRPGQWISGNLGDIPVVTIDYRTYSASAGRSRRPRTAPGSPTTRTSHGMSVAIQSVEVF